MRISDWSSDVCSSDLNEWLCAALHRSDEMNLQVDLKTQHYMQAHLFEDQYIIMIWPKETSLRRLQHAREIVDFQLDTFIESAKRDEPRKEYANIGRASGRGRVGQYGEIWVDAD